MKTEELQEKACIFFNENRISELPQDPTPLYQKTIKNAKKNFKILQMRNWNIHYMLHINNKNSQRPTIEENKLKSISEGQTRGPWVL